MQVQVDECLPREVADIVAGLGCDVETVASEGLSGSPDELIWKVAQTEGRFLITTDLDFSDIRRYSPGTHAGFLLPRLRKEGKPHMLAYLRWLFAHHDLRDWQRCVVIATQHKVRIRLRTDRWQPCDGQGIGYAGLPWRPAAAGRTHPSDQNRWSRRSAVAPHRLFVLQTVARFDWPRDSLRLLDVPDSVPGLPAVP